MLRLEPQFLVPETLFSGLELVIVRGLKVAHHT
jgi:hypothetical protein